MKSTEEQMRQWALDEIPFIMDQRSGTYVNYGRCHIEAIAQAIHDNNATQIIDEANRAFAVEMMDWGQAELIHHKAKKAGVNVTARFILQFESLQETYEYLEKLCRK